MRVANLSPEQEARLEQARLLGDPRIRALWDTLMPAQQNTVHDPSGAVGHRYPLTVSELASLAGLGRDRIEKLAESGVIPSWQLNGEPRFESVGLIVAFSLAEDAT